MKLQKLIQAEGRTVRYEIYKLASSVRNKEEIP